MSESEIQKSGETLVQDEPVPTQENVPLPSTQSEPSVADDATTEGSATEPTPSVSAASDPVNPVVASTASDELPLKWNLTGVWEVIPERSDSLNDFLAELGVGYMIRKIVLGAKVTTTITHTRDRYHLVDKSNLGVSETNVLTDGNMQVVTDAKGKQSQIIAQCSEETNGAVYLQNTLPDKVTKTKEYRMLERRDVMKQTVEVIKNGVSKLKITRYFAKQETPEEKAANEAKWNAAYPAAASAAASEEEKKGEEEVKVSAATEEKAVQEQEEEDPFPVEWNVSGTWVVIPERSDSLDGFLKELGLNYLIRKVVMGAKVVTTIVHTPERYHLTDKSNLGISETNVLTNGKMQVVTDKEGKQAKIVARFGKETQGHVVLDTELPDGKNRTVEHRWLENRTTLRQQVEVFRGGVSKIKLNRYFAKQESEEERAAGEKAWAARSQRNTASTSSSSLAVNQTTVPASSPAVVTTPSLSVSVSSPVSTDKSSLASPLKSSPFQDPPIHALLVLATLLMIGLSPRLVVVSGLMALGSLFLAGDKAVNWFGIQAMKEERARQRHLKTNINGYYITKLPAPVLPKERKSRTPIARPSPVSPASPRPT